MPGKKGKDWASFVYECFLIHFSVSPSISPKLCNSANGSLEVDHTLLIWILRIRNKLLERGLRSQRIEESVETESLLKWVQTQIQIDSSCQRWLGYIAYP